MDRAAVGEAVGTPVGEPMATPRVGAVDGAAVGTAVGDAVCGVGAAVGANGLAPSHSSSPSTHSRALNPSASAVSPPSMLALATTHPLCSITRATLLSSHPAPPPSPRAMATHC